MAVASFFITFILCYIFAYLKGKTRKQRLAQKLKAEGYVTEGTCIHTRKLCWYDHHDLINHAVTRVYTYTYQVDGINYKKKLHYYSAHDTEPLPPDKISIYYSPSNPKKSVGSTEITRGSQLQSGCLVTMALPFLVGWTVNILVKLFYNYRRKQKCIGMNYIISQKKP